MKCRTVSLLYLGSLTVSCLADTRWWRSAGACARATGRRSCACATASARSPFPTWNSHPTPPCHPTVICQSHSDQLTSHKEIPDGFELIDSGTIIAQWQLPHPATHWDIIGFIFEGYLPVATNFWYGFPYLSLFVYVLTQCVLFFTCFCSNVTPYVMGIYFWLIENV